MSLDRLQGAQAVLHPYSDDHMGFVSQEIKEQGAGPPLLSLAEIGCPIPSRFSTGGTRWRWASPNLRLKGFASLLHKLFPVAE